MEKVGRFYDVMKEKDLYSDLLEQIKENAKHYYGNRLLFTQKEAAIIMGCSVSTINRYGLHTLITCEQLARAFA